MTTGNLVLDFLQALGFEPPVGEFHVSEVHIANRVLTVRGYTVRDDNRARVTWVHTYPLRTLQEATP